MVQAILSKVFPAPGAGQTEDRTAASPSRTAVFRILSSPFLSRNDPHPKSLVIWISNYLVSTGSSNRPNKFAQRYIGDARGIFASQSNLFSALDKHQALFLILARVLISLNDHPASDSFTANAFLSVSSWFGRYLRDLGLTYLRFKPDALLR
jgi:hypothetical protein